MVNLKWPAERTFKYEFNSNLEMEIPAFDTSKKMKRVHSKTEMENPKATDIGR